MTDNEFKPDLSEAYQQLQAKILNIYKISGLTLNNIISHLAKGDVFTSPDLINRQQGMIDGLIAGQETLQKALAEKNAEIERLQKENNQFADIGKMYSEIKAEAIKEFADNLCRVFAGHSDYHGDTILTKIICLKEGKPIQTAKPIDTSKIKYAAIKKFAERLKPMYKPLCVDMGDWYNEIDNLVKEMVGESK